MKPATAMLIVVLGLLAVVLGPGAIYTVSEAEQVIITEFGKPVGEPVTEAGLHFKMPFTQEVNVIQKQVLEWDGQRTEMPTRDKLYIFVDSYGRWRIKDPLEYFRRLRDERSAQSRLDDILGSETRNALAKHDLIEVIRTEKERKPERDATLAQIADNSVKIGVLPAIVKGRRQIEREIHEAARAKLAEFGIELLDVRFKRVNYNSSVVEKIYERMISERQQIASRFRSEGEGEAAKILGNKQRDLSVIESEAYQKVQELRGAADAKVAQTYAGAYSQSADARELYSFVKTMESYRTIIGADTTLVLSTDGELFHALVSPNDRASK